LPGVTGRCEAHHRSIRRSDHWVDAETEEIPEEIGGHPHPDPRLQSLFQQRFDHLASLSQELVEQMVVLVLA
jgi:hypothetical protein